MIFQTDDDDYHRYEVQGQVQDIIDASIDDWTLCIRPFLLLSVDVRSLSACHIRIFLSFDSCLNSPHKLTITHPLFLSLSDFQSMFVSRSTSRVFLRLLCAEHSHIKRYIVQDLFLTSYVSGSDCCTFTANISSMCNE
jgi:hypothetical protein